ncbi:MAG: FAD-dependent oxidoreductase [Caldilineae bacterium]|nr:MAG: FAD-dependent oxidoreductase [Caldilineae bacterium]
MTASTVIIGAGMAGLAAARTLHDAGLPVTVLEARDRIGGRTHTDRSLGVDLDLGAAWIHGPIANPLVPLARKHGVGWGFTDFLNVHGGAVMAFRADGSRVDEAEYTRGVQFFPGAYARLHTSLLTEKPDSTVRSMADLLDHGLPGQEELSGDAALGFYYTSRVRIRYEDAADLETVDWRLSQNYTKLPGGDLLVYDGGFGKLAQGLAAGLDIHTGVVVERIDYGSAGVRIATSQGAFQADRAIVTVPLGVLKANAIAFSPPLPQGKQAAIQRMGFGRYEKLGLRFPRIFWPMEPHRFNFLTDADPPLFMAWLNNAHYTGEPVLVAYHAAGLARHINGWSDAQLIAGALKALRTLFGPGVPEPVSYVRTAWEADPFSRGSYSFARLGMEPGDRAALAAPVGDRLFFAGEATHPHYWATVHGAYETGVHAARQVMRVCAR